MERIGRCACHTPAAGGAQAQRPVEIAIPTNAPIDQATADKRLQDPGWRALAASTTTPPSRAEPALSTRLVLTTEPGAADFRLASESVAPILVPSPVPTLDQQPTSPAAEDEPLGTRMGDTLKRRPCRLPVPITLLDRLRSLLHSSLVDLHSLYRHCLLDELRHYLLQLLSHLLLLLEVLPQQVHRLGLAHQLSSSHQT